MAKANHLLKVLRCKATASKESWVEVLPSLQVFLRRQLLVSSESPLGSREVRSAPKPIDKLLVGLSVKFIQGKLVLFLDILLIFIIIELLFLPIILLLILLLIIDFILLAIIHDFYGMMILADSSGSSCGELQIRHIGQSLARSLLRGLCRNMHLLAVYVFLMIPLVDNIFVIIVVVIRREPLDSLHVVRLTAELVVLFQILLVMMVELLRILLLRL